jgi:hypothetical protein
MSSNMPATEFSVRDPNYVERVRAAFGRQGFLRMIGRMSPSSRPAVA